MATKLQLLATLEAADLAGFVGGFSMADDKTDLEAAVAGLDPVVDRRKGV